MVLLPEFTYLQSVSTPWYYRVPQYFYRQDAASSKLLVLNLLTGKKNQHFCPAGATRCTNSRHLAQLRGMWVRLAVQNFTPIGARGWERCLQNGKNFHFLVRSCPTLANPLTDFFVGAFIRPAILH